MTSRHRVPCSTNPDEALQVFVMRDVQGEDENPLLNQHLEEIGLARFDCPQVEEEGGEGEELSASPPPPSDDSESTPGWNSAFETKQREILKLLCYCLLEEAEWDPMREAFEAPDNTIHVNKDDPAVHATNYSKSSSLFPSSLRDIFVPIIAGKSL